VLGAVVATYNVPGVTQELNFTPEALAGIYLGTVAKWNDPVLAKANPRAKLPAAAIIPVRRSDGSGTTFVWTDFLSKASPAWKSKVGSGNAVSWPAGLGAKGNEGVSGLVKQNKMAYGRIQNASGAFVRPDLNSVTAAAASAAANMPDDFRVSITYAAAKEAYPVSSFTWLLLPSNIQDGGKRKILTDFLRWMLHEGQAMAEPLGYAPLPKAVIAKELMTIGQIR
jgi:phosphate transport system substrate-binding protein